MKTGSGLVYQRNRFVDPVTGTFTQADPLGLGGGLSAWGFVGGDPVNYSDPFGLCTDPTDPSCKSLAEQVGDAARAQVRAFVEKWGLRGLPILGNTLAEGARGVVKNTHVSIDVNAGNVTTSFARDATSVDLSSSVGLNVTATATFLSPKAGSGPTASVGGLFGEGIVGGGALKVGADGVRGVSVSGGVGVQLPAAASKFMNAIKWISITAGEQKNSH
jgi:uncharacterized protein RhaS with RHS repeats